MKILVNSARNFIDDKVLSLSAALSFYTILSFAPLVILAVWVAGSIGPDAQESLLQEIQALAGTQAHDLAKTVVDSATRQPGLGSIAGIGALLLSVLSATTVFAQLQSSLNSIWHIEAKPGSAVWGWIRRRVLSMGIIAAITFVLITSLVVTSLLELFLSQEGTVWDVLNQILSIIIFTGLFTFLFRYLPDARLPWTFAIRGGVVTALLFGAGRYLIGLYLSKGGLGGAYGAAGSLVFLLIWVYYSSAIFFFGAEVVQTWVKQKGEVIPLTDIAEPKQ